jgi:PhnB protein
MQVIAYWSFNGNCREAMQFYQQVFGAELLLQSLADTAPSRLFPPAMERLILQARLTLRNGILLASDLSDSIPLSHGNAFAIRIETDDPGEFQYYHKQLAKKGACSRSILPANALLYTANICDQFGHHWILSCNRAT